jgi:hypothetical protein
MAHFHAPFFCWLTASQNETPVLTTTLEHKCLKVPVDIRVSFDKIAPLITPKFFSQTKSAIEKSIVLIRPALFFQPTFELFKKPKRLTPLVVKPRLQ